MRVLWVVDSMKKALEEAQMGSFLAAADPSRLSVDLLALAPGVNPELGPQIEKRGGFVFISGARSAGDIGAFLRTRRWIRDGRYDMIHTHGCKSSLWGAVAGRLAKVPVVATLYGVPSDEPDTPENREERTAMWALRRWAARVVALSGAQWDRYIQAGTFSRAVLEVAYQGVKLDPAAMEDRHRDECHSWLRRKAKFPLGSQIAVTVADLDDWRSGVDVLLWGIPAIGHANSKARFVVVGDGEHKKELQRRVRARGLNNRIYWHPPGDDLDRILAGGHVFIHPSLRDPFPIAALRAMAAGLPVIGTRVGDVPEIIGTAEAGRLVPRSDADALAAAVIQLLEDPAMLAVMGQSAHLRAQKLFPVSAWVERMERIYEAVVEEAREGDAPKAKSYARLNIELLRPTEARS